MRLGNAAQADGITSFNIDKGDACFLGITVVCGGQREALPRLAPEWEQALESDLSRAIARAVEAQVAAAPPAPKVDTAALDTVKTMIPDTSAVSVEDGSQALRDTAPGPVHPGGRGIESASRCRRTTFFPGPGQPIRGGAKSRRRRSPENSGGRHPEIAANRLRFAGASYGAGTIEEGRALRGADRMVPSIHEIFKI